jgi:hypothetical protein
LEREAEALLNKAFPKGLSPPIDIDLIAEAHLGLEIFPVPGLEDNHDVWGVLWKSQEGEYRLVVDEAVMDCRPALYRFTLGEEIAHYVLHRAHFDKVQNIEQACAVQMALRSNLHYMERNAKWFSSALLMPSQLVRGEAGHTYANLVSHVGYTNADAVLKKLTSLLALQFRVSSQAMKYRLENHPCNVTEAVKSAMAGHHASLWEEDP